MRHESINLSNKQHDFHSLERRGESWYLYLRTLDIRTTSVDDLSKVMALYRRVAANPGRIARLSHEVTEPYVRDFLQKATSDGVALVATDKSGDIVAEIHACSPGPFCFSHILSDLTVVVDTRVQGKGVGRLIFEAFLQRVSVNRPNIVRVELVARESNQIAISFYKSLGFCVEGALQSRIRNLDGSMESDIPMAWFRR